MVLSFFNFQAICHFILLQSFSILESLSACNWAFKKKKKSSQKGNYEALCSNSWHCHGAWCWYKVVSLLKSVGHRVTPLDMGACGIDSKKINEVASLSDHAQPLMEFLASLPQQEKVVLVGHSFGGITISLAMESYPDKVLAGFYLTAFMPNHDSPPATGVE